MTQKTNLSAGRGYLAIPGPSVMPEAVLQAMHRGAPNIYAGEMIEMVPGIARDLCHVARTDHNVAMYIGNGHAAWEASLANVIAPGDKVLVPSSGSFADDWADMARALGAEAEVLSFGTSAPFDNERIAQALAADKERRIKAVLAVHVDTSSSIRNDIAALRAVIDDISHPALLMVDCIASLACDVFEMDAWGVDVMVAGSQKGLMVPPGICFVFFNDKAALARADMPRVSRYWDWSTRVDPEVFFHYWNGTAPTHHLYGLRTALDMIHAEGIEAVWQRHAVLARAVWTACETWAERGAFAMNVRDPAFRSTAVTSLQLKTAQATALREWTQSQIGLTLGIGLGIVPAHDPEWHRFFRLGHMGHVNGHMIMGLLGGIEAGLIALDIDHGKGALAAAAEVIAQA